MCGIVGRWGESSQSTEAFSAAIQRLSHRGPDDSGMWSDMDHGILLGHARLSILDLSPAGHQPMHSACGRYVIVFNGEIYNHMELRAQLEKERNSASVSNTTGQRGVAWRGHSDTETILACFSAWSVEKTLKALVGMFAFALWDREEEKLVLARDRMGEKPLYYGYVGGSLAFASELKALRVMPGFKREIDRRSLALQLRYSYIPAPYSIYKGLAKLPAGTWLEIALDVLKRRELPLPLSYWSALEASMAGVANQLAFDSDLAATDALEAELRRSVAGQMISDVPLGAFLSGGIDSSTVVAMMQAQSSRRVATFSIGFSEDGYDEALFARAVAQHLGTEHTELYVAPSDAIDVIPKLPTIYDEPFSDSSQIPTYLVAQLARKKVTVSLSGDGGDELFGGYNRYFLAGSLWGKIGRVPLAIRRAAAGTILGISPASWGSLYRSVSAFIPAQNRWPAPGDKLHKGASLLGCQNGIALYRGLVSHWDPAEVVLGGKERPTLLNGPAPDLPSLTEQMMLLDTISYLPDDILVKVDRAAMAVSLETRVPLIDHRVYEFAWRLPLHYKVRGGVGKWLLRQVLYKHVPRELIDRPKMGFGVPIDSWLRGPLREWAENLLGASRLRQEGFLSPGPIRQKWTEHLSGKHNWQYFLWDVLMFQAWLEQESKY